MSLDEEIEWNSGSRKRQGRRKAPEGRKSIPQAQLDRISHPSSVFHHEWVRRVNQFLADPSSWPSSSLKEDSEEWLPGRITAQREAVKEAAESGDSREWSRQMDKLDRLEAQRHAMTFALERRKRQERARLANSGRETPTGTTSARSTRPSPAVYDPAQDPFADQ